MSVFPQFGTISPNVSKTIKERTGNNVAVSKLMPWFRVASAGSRNSNGLVLESIPVNNSFGASYGGSIDKERKSGRVGTDFSGNSVYAAGTDRIHRPSPTIDSLSIENGNRGLSKKAKFTITCHTLAQAELISEHFMEPGFIVLVEFGFNLPKSLNKRLNLASDGPCGIAMYNNYTYVLNKRNNSDGTYDGFMGYITGGGMINGDGETYKIDVELTTLGEIPAYLQVHKDGSKPTESGEGKLKFPNQTKPYETYLIDARAQSGANGNNDDIIGKALWMQMFNRLPPEKQTIQVKAMENGVDVNNNPWTSKANFINMDDTIREKIGDVGGKEYSVPGTSEDIEIPDGMELITNQSFIRAELAFAIINSYSANVQSKKSTKCGDGVRSLNFTIDGINTTLRAHKNIFSTDLSKVYIPNSNLPEFGLEAALTSKEITTTNSFVDVNNLKTINGCFFSNTSKYAFPAPYRYNSKKKAGIATTTADAYEWGYLRNLYINFDFFLEVIKKTNLVAKDIFYELLNGISSAVNSYWEFDIHYTPSDSGNNEMHLAVWDSTFSGNVKKSPDYPKWQMSGVNSPFLSANMDITLPAAMRNHILGLRSSNKVYTQVEGNPQQYLFAQGEDRVMTILNSLNAYQTEVKPPEKPTGDEIIKANLDIFLGRALLLPKIQSRNASTGTSIWNYVVSNKNLQDVFLIGGWSDSNLLNSIKMVNDKKSPSTKDSSTVVNPAILGISFEFETIGISGIKVGDMFVITDLPSQYKKYGVFQVMEISHSLSSSMWKTTVKGQMRNMER